MENELLTLTQTAEYLQLSVRTVRRLIAGNKLRASKISGNSWRIKKSDIEAYYKANANLSEGEQPNGE